MSAIFASGGLELFLTFAGWAAAGIFAIVGIFNRQARQQRSEDSQTAENLIKNLRITTELQEKEISSLRAREVENGKEIAHLQGQVKVLADILQGRDPGMQEVFKEAPEVFQIARENNAVSKANGQAIANLTEAITNFLKKMEPIITNLSQQAA